jgi:ABC-type sugar transport system permease subunit
MNIIKQLIEFIPHARTSFASATVVTIGALIGFLAVGQIYSDFQARTLLEAMAPTITTLCFAVITSMSTILTLLLTLIGLSNRWEHDFDKEFYIYLRLITLVGAISLIASALLLLFLSIPFTESEQLQTWFSIAYYIVVLMSSFIAGATVSVIVALYQMIMGLIDMVTPHQETEP